MSKAAGITHLLVPNDQGLDPHYAGWFACFNRGDFFEAHEVLEALWLRERGQPNARFYQGLIQLAGAFVHIQKNRRQPADSLFRLAEANLAAYPDRHLNLDLALTRSRIREWRATLAGVGSVSTLLAPPGLPRLEPSA